MQISSLVDGGQCWRRCWSDNIVYTDWNKNNFYTAVNTLLSDVGGKVGVEMDHLTVAAHGLLVEALPECGELVDIGEHVMRSRMVKSQEEMDVIRVGAQVADIGGAACK